MLQGVGHDQPWENPGSFGRCTGLSAFAVAGGEMPRRVRGVIYEPADSRDPPVEVQDRVLVDPAQVLEVGERYSSFGPGRAEGEKN